MEYKEVINRLRLSHGDFMSKFDDKSIDQILMGNRVTERGVRNGIFVQLKNSIVSRKFVAFTLPRVGCFKMRGYMIVHKLRDLLVDESLYDISALRELVMFEIDLWYNYYTYSYIDRKRYILNPVEYTHLQCSEALDFFWLFRGKAFSLEAFVKYFKKHKLGVDVGVFNILWCYINLVVKKDNTRIMAKHLLVYLQAEGLQVDVYVSPTKTMMYGKPVVSKN